MVKKHVDSDVLYNRLGVQMYHYSYTFPDQVYKKVNYYKDSVSRDNCIDDYFNRVYLPWVSGDNVRVEEQFMGVHEFKPYSRGECFTSPFILSHPESIIKDIDELKNKFNTQLKKYKYVK